MSWLRYTDQKARPCRRHDGVAASPPDAPSRTNPEAGPSRTNPEAGPSGPAPIPAGWAAALHWPLAGGSGGGKETARARPEVGDLVLVLASVCSPGPEGLYLVFGGLPFCAAKLMVLYRKASVPT